MTNYSIRLWATKMNRLCSNCRHLKRFFCRKPGNGHRNRSSRAGTYSRREINPNWFGVRLSIVPLASSITVNLKMFFLKGRLQKGDWEEFPNNWAIELSEMNTVAKPQLTPCGLVPSPSVSSWSPLGPSNSSGSKKSLAQIFPQPHRHVPGVQLGDLWLWPSF